jgi:Flp pilus assembly protein TadG
MSPVKTQAQRVFGRSRRGERGQAFVEFALILPVFVVLVFAVIDFGNVFSKYVSVTNAAREGARYGITASSDTSGIQTRVQNTSGFSGSELSNMTVSSSCSPSCNSGNDVVVTVTYHYTLITPLAGLLNLLPGHSTLNSTITVTSTATMRIE